jgi:hypothetical protein
MLTRHLQETWKQHEHYSGDLDPSLWKVIPGLEQLMVNLGKMAREPKYARISHAIHAGIEILEKYYNKLDSSPAHVLNICSYS